MKATTIHSASDLRLCPESLTKTRLWRKQLDVPSADETAALKVSMGLSLKKTTRKKLWHIHCNDALNAYWNKILRIVIVKFRQRGCNLLILECLLGTEPQRIVVQEPKAPERISVYMTDEPDNVQYQRSRTLSLGRDSKKHNSLSRDRAPGKVSLFSKTILPKMKIFL